MPWISIRERGRWSAAFVACAWGSFVLSLVAWLILREADAFWLGTLLAFGPRWVVLLPVGGLVIPAAIWQRRSLVPLGLAAVVVAGPVMGLCVPWGSVVLQQKGSHFRAGVTRTQLKIITCNTLQGQADDGLKELIESEQPDVLVLQEWPAHRPPPVRLEDGWAVARAGGIIIASRTPIVTSEPLISPTRNWQTIGLRCELSTPNGAVQAFGLHLLTPREGVEAVLESGFRGLEELASVTEQRQLDGIAMERWLDEHPGPKLIAGDLNMPVESTIYRRRLGHLRNAFSVVGWGWGSTKFTRVHGVRIDHVLADKNWEIKSCEVGPNVGSDHRPVVAEVLLN